MTEALETALKHLHLANARRIWRELIARAEKESWSYEQFLRTMLTEEISHRRETRLQRGVRAARFPFLRTIEEFDFNLQSSVRLTTCGSLLSPDFVTQGRTIILSGKPGRGKTHLAIAIAYRALQNGFDVLFVTAADLIQDLSHAAREGAMRAALARYLRPALLVIDELGYLAYEDDAANVLFHVVNERNIRGRAMVFTTNKAPKRWGEVLHDPDLADAIVDRILERGLVLKLDGPSMRTRHVPQQDLDEEDPERPTRISGTDRSEFPEPTGLMFPACMPVMRGRRGGEGRLCGLPRVGPVVPSDGCRSSPVRCDGHRQREPSLKYLRQHGSTRATSRRTLPDDAGGLMFPACMPVMRGRRGGDGRFCGLPRVAPVFPFDGCRSPLASCPSSPANVFRVRPCAGTRGWETERLASWRG